MPFRECAPRSGLEVLLESRGMRFVGEFDDHVNAPRLVLRRVRASASVVRLEPLGDVARESDVVATRPFARFEHVHEMSRCHATIISKLPADGNAARFQGIVRAAKREELLFLQGVRPRPVADPAWSGTGSLRLACRAVGHATT